VVVACWDVICCRYDDCTFTMHRDMIQAGAPRLFKSILTVHLRLWVVILLLRNGGRWRMETETGEEHENRVDGGDK
jgi:hypothetical protein